MGKSSEKRREVNDLLDRVATSLKAGELPTVQDSVDLELLALQYWEKDKPTLRLGLRTKCCSRLPYGTRITLPKLDKDEVLSIVNHFVCLKRHCKEQEFATLVRHYRNGDITGSDLFGERDRKPRNGRVWQYRNQLGELAELVRSKLLLKTGNETFLDGLYSLLEALSSADGIDEIVRVYNLPSEHKQTLSDVIDTLTSIRKEFDIDPQSSISAASWRELRLEYKNDF